MIGLFTAKAPDDLDDLLPRIIRTWDGKKPIDIEWRIASSDKSARQNRLYWKWMTEIEQATGNDREYMHRYFKNKYLSGIYMRDNGEYAKTVASVNRLKEFGMEYDYRRLRDYVIKSTSITTATMKQMAEYMTLIKHDVITHGIVLTDPAFMGIEL